MILRHACPERALASIRRGGIDPARSRGKLIACWLHGASRTPWAVVHVEGRHEVRGRQVVVVEVDVPRSWLRRWGRGLWYCTRVIPPERFRRVIRFGEVSASPVEG